MLKIRTVPDIESAEIEALLAMDKLSVYKKLSPYIGDMGIMQDFDDWINSKKGELYELICIKGRYCEFISEHRNAGPINIAAALADVLLQKYGGVIPVNTLSVAIMLWGIAELCEC